jgi:inner membrane protein
MKGSTHLAIGGAIGVAAILYYPVHWDNDAYYLSVAAFSALSADLDGTSLLISKLSKLSRWLRELTLWIGVLLIVGVCYLYFVQDRFYPAYAMVAVTLLLIGFVSKTGAIRNAMVSLVGCGLLYAGCTSAQTWLIGLGVVIAVAPWLKHRGMTHTVWALGIWGAIGWGLENQLRINGIMAVSIAGYASHLIADTLTPSGVKWLFPLYKKSIKLPFM